MGFMSKITPKKTPAVLKPLVPGTSSKNLAPVPMDASGLPDDDEPTVFTTFSVFYLGFFALTLLIYPSVHAADGPFTNPMAYWTTITPTMAAIFRIVGCGFLTLCVGPFLDEIFGGSGVSMMAFARQAALLNVLTYVLFTFYGFYAPVEYEIAFMWQIQAAFAGLLVGWSFVEVVPTGTLKSAYTAIICFEFAGFAFPLASMPEFFFGANSVVAYWKTWGDMAVITANSLGVGMIACFLIGYIYFGKEGGFTKLCTVWNVVVTGITCIPAFYGGDSAVASMWQIQVCMQIPFLVIGLYLELAGATGPWTLCPTVCPPKWGANAPSFMMAALIFNLPFIGGFYYDPNFLFGPSNPLGVPMFYTDLNETALWFGKMWATVTLVTMMGPYLFGLPFAKVMKQMTIAFLLYTIFFIYVIFFYPTAMNVIMVGPVTGINFLFVVFGFYSLSQSGEDISLFMA